MLPRLDEEFFVPYVREIVKMDQADDLPVMYHNCGNGAIHQIEFILRTGVAADHFGNFASVQKMLEQILGNIVTMGKVDSAGQFCRGTAQFIREVMLKIVSESCGHSNFVISLGCDIQLANPWKSIEVFFAAANEYYQ